MPGSCSPSDFSLVSMRSRTASAWGKSSLVQQTFQIVIGGTLNWRSTGASCPAVNQPKLACSRPK
jgi:hypothetical protein